MYKATWRSQWQGREGRKGFMLNQLSQWHRQGAPSGGKHLLSVCITCSFRAVFVPSWIKICSTGALRPTGGLLPSCPRGTLGQGGSLQLLLLLWPACGRCLVHVLTDMHPNIAFCLPLPGARDPLALQGSPFMLLLHYVWGCDRVCCAVQGVSTFSRGRPPGHALFTTPTTCPT